MDETNGKKGTTYNIKFDTGEKTPDGKTVWKFIGKVFIRENGSGGAAFIGEGETQKVYALFPKSDGRVFRARAVPEAAPNEPAKPHANGVAKAAAGAWG